MHPRRFNPFGWLLVIGWFALTTIACSPADAPAPQPEASPVAFVEPVDRGNGVYYFPVTGEQYIESLVRFYEGNGKHCDLQGSTEKTVLYRHGWQSGTAHTETTGFIVHCHDLAIEAQSVTVP